MDKFEKFIGVLESSLEAYRSSDSSIALQLAINAVKDDEDVCFGPIPEPIELFVGAKCVLRRGDTVTINRDDGSHVYPFLGVTNSGSTESFQKNGKYRDKPGDDPMDIVMVLNKPEQKPAQEVIELFVGAKCLIRSGNTVLIAANDGHSACAKNVDVWPFMTSDGIRSYKASGKYTSANVNDPQDIIRILNPQDRPSPVKYRQVNQFDVDKDCEYWNEDSCSWKPCVLKAIYKTPAPDGSRFSIYDHSSREEWSLEPEDVQIVAKDNDPAVKTWYANMYPGMHPSCHRSREAANASSSSGRVACVKIEYIDGQYDA